MQLFKLIFAVVAAFLFFASTAQSEPVPPCDKTCHRTSPEWNECCRAHGFKKGGTCSKRGGDKVINCHK